MLSGASYGGFGVINPRWPCPLDLTSTGIENQKKMSEVCSCKKKNYYLGFLRNIYGCSHLKGFFSSGQRVNMQCNLMSSASVVPVQHSILSQRQLHQRDSQPRLSRCTLSRQPGAIHQLEEGGRLGLPQEGGRPEGQRRPGDPLLPAGGHGNVRVRGREPPRDEHGEGEALLLR